MDSLESELLLCTLEDDMMSYLIQDLYAVKGFLQERSLVLQGEGDIDMVFAPLRILHAMVNIQGAFFIGFILSDVIGLNEATAVFQGLIDICVDALFFFVDEVVHGLR